MHVRRTLVPLLACAFAVAGAARGACAQTVPLEYQVKAAYLFNFAKFVDWPAALSSGPLVICVAVPNPFGMVLEETVHGETISGRPIVQKTIAAPEPGCHVVFVPRGASASAYIGASRGIPVLIVGETPHFIADGGMINFVIDGGTVRFEINQDAASRAGLQISSRLLRLARPVDRNANER
jgi:hypothetical protein